MQKYLENRKKRKEYYQDIKKEIQQELFRELDFTKELEEEELFGLIDEKIHETALKKGLWLEEKRLDAHPKGTGKERRPLEAAARPA